jgi:hypothetical protein
MLNKVKGLFDEKMLKKPEIKQKGTCGKCGQGEVRYKIKNSDKAACSLECYKLLVAV